MSRGRHPRLLVFANRERRDVTPPGTFFQAEDVFFLDRRRGWFVSNDCVAARASVHRTRDGGRSWFAARVEPTNCAAGSSLSVTFADPRHGWLVRIFENGPGAVLERTGDGGVTWRRASELPLLGRVTFPTSRQGWLAKADVAVPANLFHSMDGGLTWVRERLRVPPGWRHARMFPDLPRFFGRRGVLPVTLSGGRGSAAAFYTTADGGRTWTARAVERLRFRALLPHNPFPRYAPVSIVSPTRWWLVTAVRPARLLVTRDAGMHWSASAPPALARAAVAEISGAGASAWLTLTGPGGSRLLATSDLGRSWQRLALAP